MDASSPTTIDSTLSTAISDVAKGLPDVKKNADDLGAAAKTSSDEAIKSLGERETLSKDFAKRLADSKPPAYSDFMKGLSEPTAPPTISQGSSWDKLFSLQTALSVFGGALTRQPTLGALKAATASINAQHDGDRELADAKMKEWKLNNDHINDLMQWRTNAYKNAMEEHKDDISSLTQQFGLIAGATQDKLMEQAIRSGDFNAAQKVYDDQLKTLSTWQEHRDAHDLAIKRLDLLNNKPLTLTQTEAAAVQAKVAEGYSYEDALASVYTARQSGKPQTLANVEASEFKRRVGAGEDPQKVLNSIYSSRQSGKPESLGQVEAALLKKKIADGQDPMAALDEVLKSVANAKPNFSPPVQVAADDGHGGEKMVLAQQNRADGSWVTADATREPIADVKRILTQAERSGDVGLLNDASLTQLADQYLAGDKSVFTNLGRGAQGSKNIVNLRNKISEAMDARGITGRDQAAKMAEYAGLTAGYRVSGTRSALLGMATEEAKQMAPIALEASEKIDRTDYPTLNSVLLAGDRMTGDEDAVRLGIATNSLINIYARAINPTGVATVSDKDHARELLSAAWSNGQYRAGVDQLMRELAVAGNAPGIVREEFRKAITEVGEKPSASVMTKANQAFGSYDPDLFEYRVNPKDGVIERRQRD